MAALGLVQCQCASIRKSPMSSPYAPSSCVLFTFTTRASAPSEPQAASPVAEPSTLDEAAAAPSVLSQRLDRIEPRRLVGGVNPEEEPDENRDAGRHHDAHR